MPEPPSITRRTTVAQFLKTATGLRVGPKPIDAFLARLDALALTVAQKAAALAHDNGGRPTLLKRDITQAFDAVAGAPSGTDPAAVFALIDRLTTDQIATLVNQIRDWLASRPRQ